MTRVGDVIKQGQPIPDDVVQFVDQRYRRVWSKHPANPAGTWGCPNPSIAWREDTLTGECGQLTVTATCRPDDNDALYLARKSRDEHLNRLEAIKGELANAGYADPDGDPRWIGNDVHALVQRCMALEAERRAEPGPAVFEVPQPGANVTRVTDTGRYYVLHDDGTWWSEDGTSGPWHWNSLIADCGGRLTDATPPREPRTWPRLIEETEFPALVEVGSLGRLQHVGDGDYEPVPLNDASLVYRLLELRLLGDVREVIEP